MLTNSAKILLLVFCFQLAGCSSSGIDRYSRDSELKEDKKENIRYATDESERFSMDSLNSEISEADDPDDLPDDSGIDITEVVKTFNQKEKNTAVEGEFSDYKEKVLMEIIKYLNTPYKYGGNSKNGIDCSAFTQTVYANTFSLSLLRSAREQYTQGQVISSREQLEFGDLVFFNTRRRVKPGHVGIYIGDNLFAHASSKHGVIVSSMDHEYYSKRFMGARRLEELPQ